MVYFSTEGAEYVCVKRRGFALCCLQEGLRGYLGITCYLRA